MQKFVEKEHFKFHDLINNWPGKSGNLKPQESLQVLLLLLCFLFRSSPPQNDSRKNCSKIWQNAFGKPAVEFCFSNRA